MIAKPGLYDDLPFADYLQIPAMNFHTLKALEISALHLKAVLDGKIRAQTEAMRFGRAIHCGALTPELLEKDHPTQGYCVGATQKGKPCSSLGKYRDADGDYWCGTHRDKDDGDCVEVSDFVKPDELTTIAAINEVIHVAKHPAAEMLRGSGRPEVTIVFERMDVLCKCRLDWLADGSFCDIKKKQVGTLGDYDLLKANVNYGYIQQISFYAAGVASIQGGLPEPSILYVEDGAPYDMTVMPIDDQSTAIGLAEVDQFLSRYKRHLAEDHWPGVYESCVSFETGKVKRGGLPKWKRDEAIMAGLVDEDSWPKEALRGIDAPPALTGFDE